MDALQILSDNRKAENRSFLFYLHEENRFEAKALAQLCAAISALSRTHPDDRAISARINFVYGQVLQHILYHFDPNDASRICNLPHDYYEKLGALEKAVTEYFNEKG